MKTIEKRYYYRAGKVRVLKDGVDPAYYESKYQDARRIRKPSRPSEAEIEKWMSTGMCRALDGCVVELDGVCPHGCPSRILYYGMV